MNVLEKILEEIEERKQEHLCNAELEIEETVNRMEELNWVCALIYYMEEVKKANVQTNDDWIPCSKRLPTKDMDNHPVWITYGSCGNLSTKIAYCEWVLSQDENGDDDSYNRFRIEQSPEAYYPSANLVHAWKPVKIPEPYRAADSKQDWKEHILNTFLAGH